MDDTTINIIMIAAMALLGGIGAFLFTLPPPKKKIKGAQTLSQVYRTAQGETIEEMTIVNRIAVDMSKYVGGKPSADLETRLRKSGYRYKSVSEYMYRRLVNAAAFAVFGVFMGSYFFGFGVEILILLAAGAAVYGFRGPDITINNSIKSRSEKLQLEMGYVMEQFLLLIDAGVGYQESLVNCSGMGDFGAFLGKIAENLQLADSASKAIEKASFDIPIFPEMEQFLDLLQAHIVEKQDISAPLHAMSLTLREKFNNDIKKKSGSAKLKALAVLIGFGGAATLIVVMLPLAKVLFR
jgi:hypothetical protein